MALFQPGIKALPQPEHGTGFQRRETERDFRARIQQAAHEERDRQWKRFGTNTRRIRGRAGEAATGLIGRRSAEAAVTSADGAVGHRCRGSGARISVWPENPQQDFDQQRRHRGAIGDESLQANAGREPD